MLGGVAKKEAAAPVWARVLSAGIVLLALGALNLSISALVRDFTLFGLLVSLGVIAVAAGSVMFLFSRRS